MDAIPFLKEIALYLLRSEDSLKDTCVVFPNKRARLYLSRYLGELTSKPLWAPRYITISELMEKTSGCIYADRWTLLFELYDIYTSVTKAGEGFDTFLPYADTILADFDEVDKYLIQPMDLFNNLIGLKNLEDRFHYLTGEQTDLIRRFWSSFDPEHVTETQKMFVSLWEALPQMYDRLRSRLNDRNLAYEGLACRKVAETLLRDDSFAGFEYENYIFAGFNALNPCEERLFHYLKNRQRASFFWDYDTEYTSNALHEAGFFMRKNLKSFPSSADLPHQFFGKDDKNFYFIPVSSNSGQASVLPHILEQLGVSKTDEMERTAIVLADENILFSVLYGIPGSVDNLNITMGYPITGSPVFSLIDSLCQLIRNSRQDSDGQQQWYHKDVLAIMGHPLLIGHFGDNLETVRHKIMAEHRIYLNTGDINGETTDPLIFSESMKDSDACSYLHRIILQIINTLSDASGSVAVAPVHREILNQVLLFISRLQDIIGEHDALPGPEPLFRLIRKMMRSIHVPFNGEPLAGLQVLGILETRTLDFENVIILSANEGVLPKSTETPSFIPQSLRAGFGLPTREHRDAIYAYYFYRLIQRAKNVVMIYDSTTGGLRTGERSRFMQQLYYEYPRSVKELKLEAKVKPLPVKPIVIEKLEPVMTSLSKYYTGEQPVALSPSAINEFITCSLRFYFHYIAGLSRPDEVVEEIDARILGNIMHKALKVIYTGLGQVHVDAAQLEKLLSQPHIVDSALDNAFSTELFGDSSGMSHRSLDGYNLIIRQIIRKYILQLIRAESRKDSFRLVSLEQKYITPIPVKVDSVPKLIHVGGIIDRVDSYNGKIRIIDYKTGSVKNRCSSVESLFDADNNQRNGAVLQVLLYTMVYGKLFPGTDVIPGLYFIRNSHASDFTSDIYLGTKKGSIDCYSEVSELFETLLEQRLASIFDRTEPFRQTGNLNSCRNCPFTAICRREE